MPTGQFKRRADTHTHTHTHTLTQTSTSFLLTVVDIEIEPTTCVSVIQTCGRNMLKTKPFLFFFFAIVARIWIIYRYDLEIILPAFASRSILCPNTFTVAKNALVPH